MRGPEAVLAGWLALALIVFAYFTYRRIWACYWVLSNRIYIIKGEPR